LKKLNAKNVILNRSLHNFVFHAKLSLAPIAVSHVEYLKIIKNQYFIAMTVVYVYLDSRIVINTVSIVKFVLHLKISTLIFVEMTLPMTSVVFVKKI
jgi:hypothetical protein